MNYKTPYPEDYYWVAINGSIYVKGISTTMQQVVADVGVEVAEYIVDLHNNHLMRVNDDN